MTQAASRAQLRDLVRTGTLDAELGGLLAVLLEGGLSVVVAGGEAAARRALLIALTSTRIGDAAVVELVAADDPDVRATARRFVAAAAEGLPVAATIGAADLDGVFTSLAAPPIGLTRDELSHIGLVLVLAGDRPSMDVPSRVAAAHWVRPVARDMHGHVQRPGPAVLATWDPRRGAWEHFAWGVIPELAMRLGRKAGDLELEVAERARAVTG